MQRSSFVSLASRRRWSLERASRTRFLGGFGTLAVAVVVSACSAQARHEEPSKPSEPIAECDAYGAALRACTERLGPSAAKLAATQGAFVARSATTGSERERDALRASCIAARQKLALACR